MQNTLAIFEGKKIRRQWDEKQEKWYFSVIDIIQLLINQSDYQKARKYWNKLAERLCNEGSASVTKCHQLKMESLRFDSSVDKIATATSWLRNDE